MLFKKKSMGCFFSCTIMFFCFISSAEAKTQRYPCGTHHVTLTLPNGQKSSATVTVTCDANNETVSVSVEGPSELVFSCDGNECVVYTNSDDLSDCTTNNCGSKCKEKCENGGDIWNAENCECVCSSGKVNTDDGCCDKDKAVGGKCCQGQVYTTAKGGKACCDKNSYLINENYCCPNSTDTIVSKKCCSGFQSFDPDTEAVVCCTGKAVNNHCCPEGTQSWASGEKGAARCCAGNVIQGEETGWRFLCDSKEGKECTTNRDCGSGCELECVDGLCQGRRTFCINRLGVQSYCNPETNTLECHEVDGGNCLGGYLRDGRCTSCPQHAKPCFGEPNFTCEEPFIKNLDGTGCVQCIEDSDCPKGATCTKEQSGKGTGMFCVGKRCTASFAGKICSLDYTNLLHKQEVDYTPWTCYRTENFTLNGNECTRLLFWDGAGHWEYPGTLRY